MKRTLSTTVAVFLLLLGGWADAVQLNPNTADINQNLDVAGMGVDINPGGNGCNTAAHERWEPSQGGCSDIEYQKSTAKVISVTPDKSTIDAGSGVTSLVATVITENGKPAPSDVPVNWKTSNGNLATPITYTTQFGQSTNTLTGASSGEATVTASAAGGSAEASVQVIQSTPVVTSFTETLNVQGRFIYSNRFSPEMQGGFPYGYVNTFKWAAEGTVTKYELYAPGNVLLYRGLSTSWSNNNFTNYSSRVKSGKYYNFVLRAYNGTQYTEKYLNIYYEIIDSCLSSCGA